MPASKENDKRRCRKVWWFLAIAILCPLFLTQLVIVGSLVDTTTIAATGTVQIRHRMNETTDIADAPSSLPPRGHGSTIWDCGEYSSNSYEGTSAVKTIRKLSPEFCDSYSFAISPSTRWNAMPMGLRGGCDAGPAANPSTYHDQFAGTAQH
jgi:hypothetical protein